jgi:hypothetical protein
MKDLFKVTYVISDKGIDYPTKEEEVAVPKGLTVEYCLKKNLSKYRHAMELTKKFSIKIIDKGFIGLSS